jgi:Ca2+-binding RTX toxin-like protein
VDAALTTRGANSEITNAGRLIGQIGILSAGNGAFLSNSGSIDARTGVSMSGSSSSLSNSGEINALLTGIDATQSTLLVNTGTITATADAVSFIAGAMVVRNFGTISAGNNAVETLQATDALVRNDGRIEAGAIGISASGTALDLRNSGSILAATGMLADGTGAEMLNTGLIRAGQVGMLTFGNDTILRNLGTVAAEGTNALAAVGQSGMLVINGGQVTTTGTGIFIEHTDPSRPGTSVRNSGSVEAGIVAVDYVGLNTGITLRNSGTILGSVDMGAGNDRVLGAGRFVGAILLGDGNDRFDATGAVTGAGVQGGAGNDTLTGGAGADRLDGGVGNDRIDGGAGNDLIIASTGRDTLTGGAGADVFVFARAVDAGNGASRDTITDFTPGEDRIDVLGFMAGAVWRGTSTYTATGPEIRYQSGVGVLSGVVDGDGVADWSLQLAPLLVLTASDVGL